jgi:hypothetical protein
MAAPSGPPRSNRSAKERRAECLRAEARSLQKLLQGLESLSLHRGSQPTRHGQVVRTALQAPAPSTSAIRRHFIHGSCTFGSSCRFMCPYGEMAVDVIMAPRQLSHTFDVNAGGFAPSAADPIGPPLVLPPIIVTDPATFTTQRPSPQPQSSQPQSLQPKSSPPTTSQPPSLQSSNSQPQSLQPHILPSPSSQPQSLQPSGSMPQSVQPTSSQPQVTASGVTAAVFAVAEPGTGCFAAPRHRGPLTS